MSMCTIQGIFLPANTICIPHTRNVAICRQTIFLKYVTFFFMSGEIHSACFKTLVLI